MGLIYLASSPAGKGYVGQTVNDEPFIRWNAHMSEARSGRAGSWLLNAAIREYGGNTFGLMTLWRCPDDELNYWEVYFISLFETFGPHGYNLTVGGSGVPMTPEIREKMSQSQRIHHFDEHELPSYVYYVKDSTGEGFRVRIGGKFLRIMNARQSMEEKYQEALRLRQSIIDGTFDPEKDRKRTDGQDLPKYINFDKRRNGYYVRLPSGVRKSFTSTKQTQEQNLAEAIQYLERQQI